MSANLMLDNWLLQEVTAIAKYGLSDETTVKMRIDYEKDTHKKIEVPHAAIQIESLLNLIVDIVTRESIIIDREYVGAWEDEKSPLMQLKEEGIIKAQTFQKANDLIDIRDIILKDICVTESLKSAQRENEVSWAKQGSAVDQYLSQVIWGTAGNLAKSVLTSTTYSPYPLRRIVLEQTAFRPYRPDAIRETLQFIDHERAKLYQETHSDLSFRSSQIILPPIAIEVIESSTDIFDLFSVALKMRAQYLSFREKLSHYQEVLENEDAKSINKYKKMFNSLSKDICSNEGKYGNSSISLGMGFLNIDIPMPSIDWVKSKFGIRASMQKLIFQKKGEMSLRKLINMLGENSLARSLEIIKYFQE